MSEMKRQGDVLIIERSNVDMKKLKAEKPIQQNEVVLAEGEATGHAHRVTAQPKNGVSIATFMMDQVLMLHVPKAIGKVSVTHEEHDPHELEADKVYEIRRQREYRGGEVRRVMD